MIDGAAMHGPPIMRLALAALALAVLGGASSAGAQLACIDLCSVLPNCGFAFDLTGAAAR